MASQPQTNPRLFFPFIFGVSQDQPSESGERVIFINALTQTVLLMGSSGAYDDLIPQKSSRRPASKASIAAMPSVEVVSGENSDGECAVCLEGWEGGETVKEMPCKHRFHGDCIERWLRINGCCPVCRHQMPEEDVDRDEAERERRRRRRGIWVSFSFGGGGRSSDENHDSSHDHPQTQN